MTDRKTTRLSDGRTLSYLEVGDPAGVSVLFTIGTTSSAVGALGYAAGAERNGLNLISVDKPGYGLSSRDPQRSLLRYGADLVELADALGLGDVAVAGQSGGGPHALAAAYALGSRVSTLSLLCSYGPAYQAWAREGTDIFMRNTNWLAVHAPRLMFLPVALLKSVTSKPERMARLAKRMERKMSPKAWEAMVGPESQLVSKGIADGFSNGNGAVCDEFRVIGQPWGFSLEDVMAPTDIWHGIEDKNCPIALARGMAQRLPHVTLHELPGYGHGFFGPELDEAFSTLREKALSGSPQPNRSAG